MQDVLKIYTELIGFSEKLDINDAFSGFFSDRRVISFTKNFRSNLLSVEPETECLINGPTQIHNFYKIPYLKLNEMT